MYLVPPYNTSMKTNKHIDLWVSGGIKCGELTIFAASRNTGKTMLTDLVLQKMGIIPIRHTIEIIDDDFTSKIQER